MKHSQTIHDSHPSKSKTLKEDENKNDQNDSFHSDVDLMTPAPHKLEVKE